MLPPVAGAPCCSLTRREHFVAKSAKFEYYQDRAGKWRWHLKAPNGLIIADSGQGYAGEQDCLAGANLVKLYAGDAPVQPKKD